MNYIKKAELNAAKFYKKKGLKIIAISINCEKKNPFVQAPF